VKPDILAAIDVGSNAVRLLIDYVEVEGVAYELKKAAYLRVPIRLGEDVFAHNHVGHAKAQRLIEAMLGFSHLVRAYDVSELRACATSAMRDAVNGHQLVAAIREKTGIGMDIISGQEEADLICAAASQGEATGAGAAVYVDVGGGSTELVVYKDNRIYLHDSFQVGTVRMLSIAAGKNEAVWEMEKERLALSLRDIHRRDAPARVVASGGNINKAHKLLGKKNDEPLPPEEIKELLGRLKPLSIAARMREFGLNGYRADVIVPALEIFLCICRECPSIRNVYVPKIGLADGLIHDMCKKRLAAGTYNQEDPHGR
jgi:exopolyphosphatase/guanosine-5'-triphosphate,3'-diphosphate pyrophosphatase